MKLEPIDDVVISGIGGFFPKSANIDEFKHLLFSNESLLQSRWKEGERGVCNKIGTVPSIEHFDTSYFGIHRQQCIYMDPMQRLVLERTFEALIDAGVNPVDIRGKRIGVFFGSSVGENDNLFYESIVSGFGVTGHSRSMMPNRVSYWLNLKGPSCAYDSNWINGLEVLQMAYEAVRYGYCEAAIIGTANLALNSELSWLYNDIGLLSQDGKTRAFDANASGYARSDGVVVLYIQRASEAKRCYATVLNVATRFNGNRKGNLLQVDVPSITNFLTEFYTGCKVDPKDVEFVEAYGCGLKHLDEAEMASLSNIYCKNRSSPLLVGSVKTNAGHSEASANLVSLAKVIIAMETGVIPGNIDYSTPNPKIPALTNGDIKIVTENTKWKGEYAAINGFGLSSSYAHTLLQSHSKVKKQSDDKISRVVVASTRTEEGIKEILETIKNQPTVDPEYIGLIQELFAKSIPGHLYRGYVVLDEEPRQEFEYFPGNKRQIWFVYSGMGSQWCEMAKDLMALPIFAEAIQKCHDILLPKGLDLLKIVTENDPKMFENILNSFVGIAAVQIGLTDVLRALGVVPDGIIGHSVGELGCAYGDGCMTSEQMILSAYSRGKASLEVDLIRGMMAAVGMGYKQIKDKCPPSIEVACHNGPDSSTISGPTEDMEVFVKELQDKGIFARLVNVSNIAYHSRYIKPAAPRLLEYLRQVIPEPQQRSSRWVSTSIPEEQWNSDLAQTSSAEYHTNNLLNSVLFEEGSKHIPKDSVVIEIAPHGLLQAILKRSLKAGCTNIPLTQRGHKNGLQFLLSAIGKMYLAGLDLKLSAIFPQVEYPVSKGTASLAPLVHWEHSDKWRTGLEDKQNYLVSVKDIQVTLNSEDFRDFVGHQLGNNIVLPPSAYLMVIINILGTSTAKDVTDVIFEELKFKNVINVPKIGSVPLYAMIQKGSGEFEILSGEDIIVTGRVKVPSSTDTFFLTAPDGESKPVILQLTANDVYNEFYHRGHKYTGLFKAIKNISFSEDEAKAQVRWSNNWPAFLDAMIQLCIFRNGERNQNVIMPTFIQRIAMSLPLLPTTKQDLAVTYDFSTKIISTEGLQIHDLYTGPVSIERAPVSYDSIEFIPYENNTFENIGNGINLSVQLAIQNFEDGLSNNITITEIEAQNSSLQENIKNVVNKYTSLNANVTLVKDFKKIIISPTDPALLISNEPVTEDLIKLINTSHGFLLTKVYGDVPTNPLIKIAEFSIRDASYVLLKKNTPTSPITVNVKADNLTAKNLSRTSVPWVSELYTAASSEKEVYLVSTLLPVEGITNFVHAVRSIPELNKTRFIFLLDKKITEFNVNNPVYQNLFKKDLSLCVFQDGKIGCYLRIPVEFKKNVYKDAQLASNVIANRTMHYIGINLHDETLLKKNKGKNELGNIDYSATMNEDRVTGLARYDLDSFEIVPDPTLVWKLPEQWSAEDAATVPYAYTTAYHCLIQKARLQHGETVLIHAGCSAVGLAAISIASSYGCAVYTTVATDWQRTYLKKRFNFIRDRNIFSSENTTFEPYFLMATGGVGAHVILNCLSGSLLQASVRCIADFGRFLQLGKFDLEENNSIGMSMFLKNTSFFGITIETIFEAPIEEKEELFTLIEKGIQALVVRPLDRKVVEHQDVNAILSSLREPDNVGKILIKITDTLALNQLNVQKPSQVICDSKNTYFIIGGSSEAWVDMAEWLIFRGVRKIVVSSESKPQHTYINRRLALLQAYYKAEIIYTSQKILTRDNATELLSEVSNIAPIRAIFLLPSKNSSSKMTDIKSIQYLDTALRTVAPKALFVNFISSAAGICHTRAESGFKTVNMQWDNTLELGEVFNSLDDILNLKAINIFIKNDKLVDVEQETPQALYKKLTLLLPSSLTDVKIRIRAPPNKAYLKQLTTLSPPVIREVPPVFIIPGLFDLSNIENLARNIMYPAYTAILPPVSQSLADSAAQLVAEIKSVCEEGPYNIVGVSWGGALAIEITKLLEKDGASVEIYFIDGAPETIQAALKHLGEGPFKETNLLSRILNINNSEVIKTMNGLSNWEARLNMALDNYDSTPEKKIRLTEILSNLKGQLDIITNYGPTEELVAASIVLIRPFGSSKYDNCGLLKYCKQTPQIHVVSGDHLTILSNKTTPNIINEFALA